MSLNPAIIQSNPARHLDTYRDEWERFVGNHSGNGVAANSVDQLRRTGWNEFERIGFPIHRRGNEAWKYTDLRPVDREAFHFGAPSEPIGRDLIASTAPLQDDWHNIVFIDGKLSEALSDPDDESTPVGFSSIEGFHKLGKLATCTDSAFVSLNSAFLSDGVFIDIGDGIEPAKPVHLVFATTRSEVGARAVYPRFGVSIGQGSDVTIVETHVALSDAAHLSVPVVEISLDQEASLTHYRVQMDNEASYHFATTRVDQAAGSQYRTASFSTGSSIGRNDILTILNGEYAESTLHGVYITSNRQHQDNEISTTHSAPHCTSDQYYKGILSGRSRAVFSGSILVERGAQKTEANQKDLNLLLSHGAEVDTKPSLEIYADDVQCAHGATAGHVDEDTLFYLQSRGIDYDTAQAMLIRGFAAEILAEVEIDALREFLEKCLDLVMPELQAASDTIGTA